MTKQQEIKELKQQRDAVILAHFYTSPEVQDAADYVGDSFYLCKTAAALPNATIVFCGVSFMGESAKLLCPDKTVLMPDATADCPMAHMVDRAEVERAKREYDDLAVVCYINSSAEIKSWSDVCVTSSNAVSVVESLPNKNILFIPDRNLGRYVAERVPGKNIILVSGYCPVHEFMRADEIKALKTVHPGALILAHPECGEAVLDMADFVGSTGGIIKYATESGAQEFIIATETGVGYELKKRNPGKKFYFPKTEPVCLDMKKITLEKIIDILKNPSNPVLVPEGLICSAKKPLDRMLDIANSK